MTQHGQLPLRNTTILAVALAILTLCLCAAWVLPGGARAAVPPSPIGASGEPAQRQAGALAPFRIVAHDPVRNQVGFALSAPISATTDGDLDMGTVSNDTFVVHGHLGGLASGTFYQGPGAGTLRLDPDRAFHAGEVLRVSATSGIWSAGGHTLMPYGWQFSAGDVYPRCVARFADIGAALTGVALGSVAWGDYDNDGDLDILLTGWTGIAPVSKVYRNDGDEAFTDIGAGLTGVDFSSVAWGDYDNDGDLDILLTGYDESTYVSKVYRNDGGGAFADIGAGLTGVDFSSVAWGDYDNDGDLDILLTGKRTIGELDPVSKVYRNDGGGVFTDLGAGLTKVDESSVAWGDYDNDGDLDILLTGRDPSYEGVAKVYRNDGGGTFSDIATGLTQVWGGSVGWGDYDNDGDLDILLAGSRAYLVYVSKVYRNDGGGAFTDISAGLTGVYDGSVAWGDYDNDGDLDILLTGYSVGGNVSKVYRNDGGGAFIDIGAGLTGMQGSSAAWGDYDNDGDLDILLTGRDGSLNSMAKVYRNNSMPNLGTVTPYSGSGPLGITTYFTTTWSDPDGWQNLKQCYFHIGDSPALAGNVTLLYNGQQDMLWLRSDDGAAWTGGYAPRSASTLENSQAFVYCDLTTVQGSGDALSVTWAIEFKPGYTGAKKLGLKCKDLDKATAKGKWKGTWTIE